MYINEVIERADRLLANEYTNEEKYHWCDVIGGELMSEAVKRIKCTELEKWKDGTFLLPEDCDYSRVEKFIADNCEIEKCDMSTFGMKPIYGSCGRIFLSAKNEFEKINVYYREKYEPIRRISIKDAQLTLPEEVSLQTYGAIKMNKDCPFVAGDSVKAVIDNDEYTLHIIDRNAEFDDDELVYSLICDISKLQPIIADIEVGTKKNPIVADIERIVTDKTVCEAPWDEMYIDYICAQICFYQRDSAAYQQFITRYNERFEEYRNWVKAMSAAPDDTVFKNWW